MCWQCDNPDATFDDYLDLVREEITRNGWFVQHIEGERYRPRWAYTVGLTALGLSELVVTGLKAQVAHHLLNSVTEHMVDHGGGPFTPGDHVPLRSYSDIQVVELAEPNIHLVMAEALYGPNVRGQQLVYADDRGHWPWAVGFRGKQPVLGERPSGHA